MTVHILIDGYNLIRQSAVLSSIDAVDIAEGRSALLRLLAAYRKLKRHRITVVFDGVEATWGAPERDRYQGITVVFSRRGETADQVIKRLGTTMKEKAMVVSSDRDILSSVARSGCTVISAPAFEEKLRLAEMMAATGDAADDGAAGWIPTTRKKGPSRRLPKKQRRMHRKQRKL